jgi:leucyl-tRNA synthetase
MIAPMSPHLAEELWEMLGHSGRLMRASWPQFRAEFAAEEQVEIIIQLNGKVRGKVVADVGLEEEALITLAIAEPKVAQLLDGKQVVKRIVIPDKLVNLVIR